jgi:gamma-glutamyl hydrolase
MDSGYSRTGRVLYDAVKRLNDQGDYFPLWTTCLGFELIFVLETGSFNFTRCNELDTAVNIGFTGDFDHIRNKSQIFRSITKEMFEVWNQVFPCLHNCYSHSILIDFHQSLNRR